MGIEEIIQNYNTYIVYGVHILLALYVWGEGVVFNYEAKPWMAIVLLVVSVFVYNKMHTVLQKVQSSEVQLEGEIRMLRQQAQKKPTPQKPNDSFNFEDIK